MCTSKAEGGQRCYANAKAALTKAKEAKVATEVAYVEATARGESAEQREPLLRAALAADYAYEDALSTYATTTRGRAELESRLETAPGYHQRADNSDPHRPDDYSTLRFVIDEGKARADRAAEVKRAVRAGELSPEEGRADRVPDPVRGRAPTAVHRRDRLPRPGPRLKRRKDTPGYV